MPKMLAPNVGFQNLLQYFSAAIKKKIGKSLNYLKSNRVPPDPTQSSLLKSRKW